MPQRSGRARVGISPARNTRKRRGFYLRDRSGRGAGWGGSGEEAKRSREESGAGPVPDIPGKVAREVPLKPHTVY